MTIAGIITSVGFLVVIWALVHGGARRELKHAWWMLAGLFAIVNVTHFTGTPDPIADLAYAIPAAICAAKVLHMFSDRWSVPIVLLAMGFGGNIFFNHIDADNYKWLGVDCLAVVVWIQLAVLLVVMSMERVQEVPALIDRKGPKRGGFKRLLFS